MKAMTNPRRRAIHVPALTMPLSIIARHAGMDIALTVSERLAGKNVSFPRDVKDWSKMRHGETMIRLLGDHAQAILDDVDEVRRTWSRRAITIEIPAAKSTRAAILYNNGANPDDIAHQLLMSRIWVGRIIRENTYNA
jgi:hypothetical protein